MKFIDDRFLDSQYLFPSSKAEAIAQSKQLLHQLFAPYIAQYYKNQFQVTAVRAKPRGVAGIFRSGKAKYYFTISDTGIFKYNYLQFKDRLDSRKKKKQCDEGKPCKNTCISKKNTCQGKLKSFDREKFAAVKDAVKPVLKGSLAVKLLGAIAVAYIGVAVKVNADINTEVRRKEQTSQAISDRDLEKKIRKAEKSIRDNNFETLLVFHPKTGKTIINKKGNEYKVDLSYKEGISTAGAIITHNHPQFDVSFSLPDIKTAMTFQAKEMRVTTKNAVYTLRPGNGGWNAQFYQQSWQKEWRKNHQYYLDYYRQQYQEGKISVTKAMHLYSHKTMEATTASLGLEYKRIPYRDRLTIEIPQRKKVA